MGVENLGQVRDEGFCLANVKVQSSRGFLPAAVVASRTSQPCRSFGGRFRGISDTDPAKAVGSRLGYLQTLKSPGLP